MTDPSDTKSTAYALFILRITLAVFFLIWALEKLLLPETANGIAGYFYGFKLPGGVLTVVGLIQVALVLTFAAGAHRTLTYGSVAVYHICSTLSTWFILIDPYGRTTSGIPHHLFLASVPVAAACIALFLMRKQDTLFRVKVG